jgi:hypothetical protein
MNISPSYLAFKESPHKSIKHSTYFDVYDNLFGKYVGKKVTFVEVGVLGGGSLFMWRNFLGPQARIIGVDFNPEAKRWEDSGFEIFIGNQADPNFWQIFFEKIGPVDVLLDDGGHTFEQQIITTEFGLSNINEGGVLVVEDTHTSYMDGFGPKKFSYLNYVKKLIDKINFRFHSLDSKREDKRFWSIQIFDSFVVFHISKKFVDVVSEPVDNGRPSPFVSDFRQSDNSAISLIETLSQKLSFLKGIRILSTLKLQLSLALANRKFNAKKYFK